MVRIIATTWASHARGERSAPPRRGRCADLPPVAALARAAREETEHLAQIQAHVNEAHGKGMQVDVPHEWPDPSAADIAAAKERYGY